MTATSNEEQTAEVPAGVEMVTGTIDGQNVAVPKGTMIIRAAELLGVEIPRFCDHPLLEPVAACRQCLVEIEGMPKPQPSCAIPLGDGMVVQTHLTSEVAETAQRAVLEFLLINHPLDCPVCDKGGECPLQNQALSHGPGESRFDLPKRQFAKPVAVSAQILLDRERCVSCARCTRFADQIAGDPFIELTERGSQQQIGIGEEPFDSYFSGNTIQICPVGALTSAEYRFRARPFDLVSVRTVCEHCASGCALRTDHRHQTVMRRWAWDDPEVNEEWNCDKGRFAFPYLTEDRLTHPLVREDGQLRSASWPEALRVAADGLAVARGRAAVLPGGRLTMEDAYAYARFARVALGTDDIDMRSRPVGVDEVGFLSAHIAGRSPVRYADLEKAPAVLLVGFEPEEESPIVFLRLRKAVQRHRTVVLSLGPFATTGLEKLSGRLIPTVPGAEAATLGELPEDVTSLLGTAGAVILVGERVALAPGALAEVARLAERTGAALAWVPRRAGERGAVDTGCLPGLLPGGRPLSDPSARREVASVWGIAADDLPLVPGRTLAEVVSAIANDVATAAATQAEDVHEPDIAALVVAGVEPEDVPDVDGFLEALDEAPFVVSLETRATEVTARADVVLPVAGVTEKAGTFVDWEGRRRPFGQAIPVNARYRDAEVLALLADAMDLDAAPRDLGALRAEIDGMGAWGGTRTWAPREAAAGARPFDKLRDRNSVAETHASAPETPASAAEAPASAAEARASAPELVEGSSTGAGNGHQAVLATWRMLLDEGVMQEGEPYLAATRRPAVARVSAATAEGAGVADGEPITVWTPHGSITVPARVTAMHDDVVWLPANSPGCRVGVTLRAAPGDTVRLGRGSPS